MCGLPCEPVSLLSPQLGTIFPDETISSSVKPMTTCPNPRGYEQSLFFPS